MSVATLLVCVKLVAWVLTGSVSVAASLIDSVFDAAASTVTLFASRHAMTPADHHHRFGHGKAEPLAALGQAALIAGSSVFLLVESISRIMDPQPVGHPWVGVFVMAGSIVATLALTTFQRYVAKATGSVAIEADSLHYVGDVLANVAVLCALLLSSQLGWHWTDGAFGVVIALFLAVTALQIGRRALDMLMDRELPEDERARIIEVALVDPRVHGVHEVRTRLSGPNVFIQFHLELDGDMKLREAHAITDDVEARLLERWPHAEVFIHQDPDDDAHLDASRSALQQS